MIAEKTKDQAQDLIEEARKGGAEQKPRRVCFVCTGNTCRSPMAAAVANALAVHAAEEQKVPQAALEAYSAGLYAAENQPISPLALSALESGGVPAIPGHDYRLHTAHTLTPEEAESFDLLIGLTGRHAMELMMRFPQKAAAVCCMPTDIPDPYGGDAETYRKCLEQIVAGVRSLLFGGETA